ncbi:MAG: lactate utilization protein [Planctomycetota bacterium]
MNPRADRTGIGPFISALRDRTAAGTAALRRIAAQTALPAEPLAHLREVTETEDLPERFTAAARLAGCQVQVVRPEGWVDAAIDILRAVPAKSVFVQPEPTTALTAERAAQLCPALEAAGIALCDRPDDPTLFAVEASLTGVRLAVAETGSLVCCSGPAAARGASLIPPVHIALLAATQIVPDLFDAFAALGAGESTPATVPSGLSSGTPDLPANLNFITGPSKTADIEGVLVTGVHGPGQVHVLVVESW